MTYPEAEHGPRLVPDAPPPPAAEPSTFTVLVTLETVATGERRAYTVSTDSRDHRAYARLRGRYGLPGIEGANLSGPDGILLLAFAAWNALRNRAEPPVILMDWPTFDERCVGLDVVEQVPVDPTNPAPGDT